MKITSCDCFEELCKQQGKDVTYEVEHVLKNNPLFVRDAEQRGLGKYDVNMYRPELGFADMCGWYRAYFGITYCPFCGKKIEVKDENN